MSESTTTAPVSSGPAASAAPSVSAVTTAAAAQTAESATTPLADNTFAGADDATCRREVTVTLKQAQKIMEALKQYIQSYDLSTDIVVDMGASFAIVDDVEQAVEQFRRKLSAYRQRQTIHFILQYDVFMLRNAIHAGNAESGVDLLLSKKRLLEQAVEHLKRLKAAVQHRDSYHECDVPKLFDLWSKSRTAGTTDLYGNTRIAMEEVDDLVVGIEAQKKEIFKLARLCDEINAKSKITVALSTKFLDSLGL
jgi:hypothetical protein